ncbi:MAG: GNAT family N-acetyltransferase [Alphaproteobacteria bacterium]|nr:GNAT family N-acetyltransferase [Alphaproteobacteria bacterium]
MFIVTKRLFLRPPWAEDAAAVEAAIGHWDVVSMLASAPWPYARADAEAFCATPVETGSALLLIFTRDGRAPELVGGIGFAPRQGGGAPDLGYWITPAHQGKGYAAEAGRGALALAFDGFRHREVTARHQLDNPRSANVLRRLGFEPTGGQSTAFCRGRGAEVETAEYRLTREAWRCEPARLAA